MKIKSPLKFILKKDLVDFDINIVNGAYILTGSGKFKQILKKSEYEIIMMNDISVVKTSVRGGRNREV